MTHIGQIIEKELHRQERSVTWFARRLYCDRTNVFRRAMDVFISRDVEEAKDICASDDYVDNLFSKVILEISSTIAQSSNVMGDVDLLLITKYAERMADHATNIAEWVIYIETGEHPDLNKHELSSPYVRAGNDSEEES